MEVEAAAADTNPTRNDPTSSSNCCIGYFGIVDTIETISK